MLKNNEKLARAAADSSAAEPTDVRDQGFTRAKVLVLLPLRNSALEWFRLLCAFSLCPQVDNKPRFEREYNLPQGTVDKLAMPDAVDRYPRDHRETFAGNIDDSFKFGLKVTRKSVKLFSQFYESDIIVASPLGLRLSIEEDRRVSAVVERDIIQALRSQMSYVPLSDIFLPGTRTFCPP